MNDPHARAQIPSGVWQRVLGALLLVIAVWGLIARDFTISPIFLALAGPLLFWGAMMRYFSTIEAKLDLLIHGPADEGNAG